MDESSYLIGNMKGRGSEKVVFRDRFIYMAIQRESLEKCSLKRCGLYLRVCLHRNMKGRVFKK